MPVVPNTITTNNDNITQNRTAVTGPSNTAAYDTAAIHPTTANTTGAYRPTAVTGGPAVIAPMNTNTAHYSNAPATTAPAAAAATTAHHRHDRDHDHDHDHHHLAGHKDKVHLDVEKEKHRTSWSNVAQENTAAVYVDPPQHKTLNYVDGGRIDPRGEGTIKHEEVTGVEHRDGSGKKTVVNPDSAATTAHATRL